MRIMVVDGQGGGIGRALLEKLKGNLPKGCELIAVGTNSQATAAMMKGGADSGATGENAVVYNAHRSDVIVGAVGIVCAHSMMGELSPRMAEAVAGSEALKVLIPMNRCNIQVAGTAEAPLPVRIAQAVKLVQDFCSQKEEK